MRAAALALTFTLLACGEGYVDESAATPATPAAPTTPTASTTPPSGETCGNGLDDDGNGQVDEGCSCTPSTEQACYPGVPTQKGIGQCQAGKQLCQASTEEFSSWGACTGAVLPGTEDCADGVDNDCNGVVDDGPGCACKPGESRSCYTGPAATRSIGQCKDGAQTCNASGTEWTTGCAGEVLPATEVCHDQIDNDCDGQVDEDCIVTVNVDIDGDCVWASCPSSAPYPVGCNINMAGGDCRGCIANAAGSSKVYFQEGNQCGAGKVTGQLFCSSVQASGLDASNCIINKTYKFYEVSPSGCPAIGSGSGC